MLGRRESILLCISLFAAVYFMGCDRASDPPQTAPVLRVSLGRFGLPGDYSHDDDSDCTTHVIGYRFVVWMPGNLIAVGFNTTPSCRAQPNHRVSDGIARILVFDMDGKLTAQRDLQYDADGGDELVAPGEAAPGPSGTLLFRIEEAGTSKSGVRLLDNSLNDVGRIDRFLERDTFFGHELVFQQGTVWSGPRTYDVVSGNPPSRVAEVTEDWPIGTMDRKVEGSGVAYILCSQELQGNKYVRTNIKFANAHRRCVLYVKPRGADEWTAPLQQDEVGEVVGFMSPERVVGIVRSQKSADRFVIWTESGTQQIWPWFPAGFDSSLVGATTDLRRYQGIGTRKDTSFLCRIAAPFCRKDERRMMIFDRSLDRPLVAQAITENTPVALAPDGAKYATFESGELRIYALPSIN